ncbi:MAG: glycerate kinase, partial [Candidatus Humimicrobiaceae bacterium]
MGLKILVACDKYKGSLSALEVCSSIADTIREIDKEIEVVVAPMADGGEGTVSTLVESQDGRLINLEAKGPLGDPVKSRFGIIKGDIGIIEMAAASGLWLVPKGRGNPMEATTYGTGQLIREALNLGCKKIIVGIGGSATTDAGMGMAQALGVRFYGKKGEELGLGGKEMQKVERIDMSGIHPGVGQAEIDVACDVDNPLYGRKGAAYVYSPQKGAGKKMVEELDRGLRNIARVIEKDLGKDIRDMKGAGAAGGLGGGLAAFLGAKLRPGVDIVMESISLESKIEDSDLVISGEGAMDEQTYYGK